MSSIGLLAEEGIPFVVGVTKTDLMSKHELDTAIKDIELDLMKNGFASEADGGDVQVGR